MKISRASTPCPPETAVQKREGKECTPTSVAPRHIIYSQWQWEEKVSWCTLAGWSCHHAQRLFSLAEARQREVPSVTRRSWSPLSVCLSARLPATMPTTTTPETKNTGMPGGLSPFRPRHHYTTGLFMPAQCSATPCSGSREGGVGWLLPSRRPGGPPRFVWFACPGLHGLPPSGLFHQVFHLPLKQPKLFRLG